MSLLSPNAKALVEERAESFRYALERRACEVANERGQAMAGMRDVEEAERLMFNRAKREGR
jgi:hypothetical protein